MSISRKRARAGAALATGVTAALTFSTLVAAPVAASAAEPAGTVSDAVFQWGISNEANNSAYNGSVNLLSAGKIVKNDASDTITESEWKASEGNVTIQKKGGDGSYATSTWAGLSTSATGGPLGLPPVPVYSDNRITITNGTGTVDAETNDADIIWDGDATVAFYGGLTQFFLSDPHLVVEDGFGSVTATLSGYGTDMDDTSLFVPIPDTQVTIATLSAVEVGATGIESAATDYLGVSVTPPAGGSPQGGIPANFGSFPQEMVDFQGLTGQSSYWYSSGGATDSAKASLPIDVPFTITPAAVTPSVTVSKTTNLSRTGETVTVTGTGFLPNPPATNGAGRPLSGFGGTYIVFGKFADNWKPSAGALATARAGISTKWAVHAADIPIVGGPARGAVELKEDGTFSVELEVKNGQFDKTGTFGVYTYAGGGAVYAPFETYTPMSFTDLATERIQGADRYDVAVNVSKEGFDEGADTVYIATGTAYADALGAAPAAVKANAPLLLTLPDRLPASVKQEIERLAPSKIVIVGGTAAVSAAVKTALEGIEGVEKVDRVAGADRYEASRNLAEYAFGTSTTGDGVYLATGTNFPDALSASSAAGAKGQPVILVYGPATTVDSDTLGTLATLKAKSVAIAGGTASVSAGIETQLKATDGSTVGTPLAVTRLSGADRFQTSIAVNAAGGGNEVFLATGYNYPDALAGAALAGARTAPLYVTPTDCVPQGVKAAIDRMDAGTVTLLGGTKSLSPAVASLTSCSF